MLFMEKALPVSLSHDLKQIVDVKFEIVLVS